MVLCYNGITHLFKENVVTTHGILLLHTRQYVTIMIIITITLSLIYHGQYKVGIIFLYRVRECTLQHLYCRLRSGYHRVWHILRL